MFRRRFSKGQVTLGSNADSPGSAEMYFVLVQPVTMNATALDGRNYYVSPNGSSGGDGSLGRPWDLRTALAQPNGVGAGDTLWLRGGTYRGSFTSRLTGGSTAPLIVRQFAGERATIDGNLVIYGASTWYWGFEVANTNTATVDRMGINVHAPRTKVIGLSVHDATGNGIGVWEDAANSEVVGCNIYNNGWQAAGGAPGHGIYAQSLPGNTMIIRDNMIFDQFGWGIHAYAEGGHLSGFQISGNALWNNGAPAQTLHPDVFVGGYPAQAERVTVRENTSYVNPTLPWYGGSRNMELGWGSQNRDVNVQGNWIVGSDPVLRLLKWSTAIVQDNRVVSKASVVEITGGRAGYQWSGNTWYRDPGASAWRLDGSNYTWSQWKQRSGLGAGDAVQRVPSGKWVRVRVHPYEKGRALVVVLNWDKAASVSVDLSKILRVGDRYEVRNGNSPFGPAVLVGTYAGGALSLPMAGVQPPKPLTGWKITPPNTAPEFGAFSVRRVP